MNSHCSNVKRISFAVHVERTVVQHPTRELSYMICKEKQQVINNTKPKSPSNTIYYT